MRGNYFCERIRVGTQKRDPQTSIINLVIPAFWLQAAISVAENGAENEAEMSAANI
jgi:hypothetical protein